MKGFNSILGSYGTTIFEVMSQLARAHDAINLGQGFPEDGWPEDVVAKAAELLSSESQQYPSMFGTPELRQAVAAHDQRFYGIDADWQTQVLVASGATEALTAALMALIEPGDEVVLIEPLYDTYLPIIRLAGGIPKLVRITPPNWDLPLDALADAFSERTKLILFNSPMNPTAKVFSIEELQAIADLCQRWDAYALCDEVYEHLLFDGRHHVPLITLPDMADRALRVGSAGKTFSLTGWKIGYLTGSAALIERVARAHQFLTYTTPPNLQNAIAFGLAKEAAWFDGFATTLQAKRDRFMAGLADAGFAALPCAGTYFASVDIRSVGATEDDESFCRRITAEAGVAAIPVSAFYADRPERHYVRFCFAKRDTSLDLGIERLSRYLKHA